MDGNAEAVALLTGETGADFDAFYFQLCCAGF